MNTSATEEMRFEHSRILGYIKAYNMSLLFSNVFVMLRHFPTSVLCVSVFQRYSSVLSVITDLKCHRRNHLQ